MPRAIAVQHSVGLVNHGSSSGGELITKTTEELLVGNVAISIDIIVLHESLEFNLLGEQTIKGVREVPKYKEFNKFERIVYDELTVLMKRFSL